MPRIRTVKPEFWSSPSVAGADPWVRLLFVAMWNWADDHGRGTANVKELAAFAFPHDDDPGAPTSAELPCMLAEIAGRFSVVFYEADGRRYYAIPSWDRHQRNERRAASRYPAPEDGKPYNPDPSDQREAPVWNGLHGVSDDEHGSSVHDDGDSDPGTGEQGNRGTSDSRTAAAERRKCLDEKFTEFWFEYPLKKDKQDALKMWHKIVPSRDLDPDRLIAAARSYAHDPHRKPGYTKHAATWLNKGAYDNEPETGEQAMLAVVPDLPTSFEGIRERADAATAARLLGTYWPKEVAQPPRDPLPYPEYARRARIAFIDENADRIRAALAQRNAG